MIRIRRLLLRELLTLVGFTVGLLVALAWWGAVGAIDAQADARARAGLSHMERELRNRLEVAQRLGDSLGALWRTGSLGTEPTEAAQRLLHSLLQGHTFVPNVVIAGAEDQGFTARYLNGRWDTRIRVGRGPQGRVEQIEWDAFGHPIRRTRSTDIPTDWRIRPWYRQAETSTTGTWTEPYLFVNPPVPGISYAVPVRSIAGTLLGVICVDLHLEEMTQMVWAIQPTPHCQIVISDAHGHTLVVPQTAEFQNPEAREAAFLKVLSPTFLPVIHALRLAGGTSAQASPTWPRLRVGGTTYLTRRMAFEGPPGIAWEVNVAIPSTDLLIEAKQRALASILLGLAAMGLVAWRMQFLSRRFSDPLMQLAVSSEALARGQPADPVPSDIQEIQQVGEAFHGAAQTLVERNELEARIQHIQRLETLGTMAGGIAHDVNNQLAAISGQIELGLMKAPEASPCRVNLEQAALGLERCGEITRALLTFSRPTQPQARKVDLNEVVLQAAELLDHVRGHGVRMALDLATDLPAVTGEPVQLEQVFMNLGVNAKDAMPDGGVLTLITGLHPDGRAYVRISDTGTGMPPEIKARMFEPFFTTKEEGKGTGLGLSMVFGIVKAHRATLDVESEVGRGTTFTLSFPQEVSALGVE